MKSLAAQHSEVEVCRDAPSKSQLPWRWPNTITVQPRSVREVEAIASKVPSRRWGWQILSYVFVVSLLFLPVSSVTSTRKTTSWTTWRVMCRGNKNYDPSIPCEQYERQGSSSWQTMWLSVYKMLKCLLQEVHVLLQAQIKIACARSSLFIYLQEVQNTKIERFDISKIT